MAADFNTMELMICVAARYLEDGKTVAVGTGAPCAAAMLAQKTGAPSLVVIFEAGGLAPQLPEMPISVGDSRTFYRAVMAAGMVDAMSTCERGQVDYAFLGGAQIDRFGNINSTCIGEYEKPKVRFPGSGGANDFASFCWNTMIMTVHSKTRFVEKCDFITTPGYLTGAGAREAAGLPEGGPYKIVTDLAVMGFDEKTKAMTIESLHPHVDVDKVQSETGFELLVSDELGCTELPTEEELRILRDEVDPLRLVIGRS
ncbi:MAG TPA: CoA-transferase [Thermoleophilia bacterium]|nr:CoA-transferase [Acidobacteriota bacterium]NLT93203.1 3-oxoacid CoA-transferase [Actinomycetota bacterium]OPZ46145.1 MAG: Glutaconate CoA-transferase subunit B [Actinobacteria bacterium ADurb.BinA094]HQF51490.1 CoA-transferase [Thermoleophilia bacterium]HQH22242.1 CoA-transferase [Thermoleophilia bacterium]